MSVPSEPASVALGKYFTLEAFCTCTQTYQKYQEAIDPYPQNWEETIPALVALHQNIIDPIVDRFGKDNFQLTYGFCSADLKRYLERRDPVTGVKNGRIAPRIDQHMACDRNRRGNYFCDRPGAACDFLIQNTSSEGVVAWIVTAQLPFDSLYYYGSDRPIHISYGEQHKRDIWTFSASGRPTRKGIARWVELARQIP
jgi:hypothetical protein